jgi:chloramphenicol-sensitive protein RarD
LNSRAKYFLAGASSSVIWGFFSLSLRSIKDYPSLNILIFRVFTALLLTSAIILIFRKATFKNDLNFIQSLSKNNRRQLLLRIFYSSVLVTLNWFAFIYVINHVSVQAGAFAYMVCPIVTAVFAFIFLKEELSKIKWLSIALCLVSIVMLGMGFITEVIYSVIIAALYAGYLIIQKRIEGVDKLNVLLIQLIISCVFIVPFTFSDNLVVPNDFHFWTHIVIISLVFTIIPLFLSLYALKGLPSSTMGVLIYLNPIIAFIVAFLYFDEAINLQKVIAYGILLLSVVLFNKNYFFGVFKPQNTNTGGTT